MDRNGGNCSGGLAHEQPTSHEKPSCQGNSNLIAAAVCMSSLAKASSDTNRLYIFSFLHAGYSKGKCSRGLNKRCKISSLEVGCTLDALYANGACHPVT